MAMAGTISGTVAEARPKADDTMSRDEVLHDDANLVGALPRVASAPKTVRFDESMMMYGADSTPIDTKPFEKANVVTPGRYRIDIVVNGQWRGIEEVTFERVDGSESALPCYDRALLQRVGIDLERSARGQGDDATPNPMPDGLVCDPLVRYVPGGEMSFDAADQKLYVTVPQFYLRLSTATTYVDPANWTTGMPAGMLNYNANVFNSRSHGYDFAQLYTGLNMGLNIGALRFRHNGNLTWSRSGGTRYQRGNIYAQTDLPYWRAQLLIGESSTSGALFDSISFRGVQIESDDRMMPDLQRYYAPVVRGVAQSNAKVSVYQRGYLVHETTVAPGPFALDDLRVMSYGGDLNVTITEANGETRSFVVPFATTVQQLRPGTTRFSAMAGRAIDLGSNIGEQYAAQFTLQHGISNAMTAYGGAAFATRYQSVLAGVSLNTAIGGISADVTMARTQPHGAERLNGTSVRVSYSKNLPNSGTNFSLLAYRYSTKGFLSLRDALQLNTRDWRIDDMGRFSRMRNRVDVNLSQQLGRAGNVYLNGSAISYWARSGQTLSFTLGYSTQWRDMTLTTSLQRVRNVSSGPAAFARDSTATLGSVSLSIPLGRNSRYAPTLNLLTTHDSQAGTSAATGLSGRFGAAGDGSYSMSASYDGNNRNTSGSFGVGYRLPVATVAANVSIGSGYQQTSASAAGGLVLHRGGLTPGPTLGETIGVVSAPHARGARIGSTNAYVNRSGYAIVPSLVPYQLNNVDLDPSAVPDDVELKVSTRSVAPRAGAVVMLSYDTLKARALLIDATLQNGRPLPFAARAFDAKSGAQLGVVGQGSRLFIRSGEADGQIQVKWGDRPDQQCALDYAVPYDRLADTNYVTLTRVCRPAALLPLAGAAVAEP